MAFCFLSVDWARQPACASGGPCFAQASLLPFRSGSLRDLRPEHEKTCAPVVLPPESDPHAMKAFQKMLINVYFLFHDFFSGNHLDHSTVRGLFFKVETVVMSLGVGTNFMRWGIRPGRSSRRTGVKVYSLWSHLSSTMYRPGIIPGALCPEPKTSGLALFWRPEKSALFPAAIPATGRTSGNWPKDATV